MTGSSNAGHAAALQNLKVMTRSETGSLEIPAGGGPMALPDVEGHYVRFKASPDNAAPVYVHGAGSAAGWPLAGGEETGLSPVENLSVYELSGTAGAIIYYEVLS